jgi:3-hydroxy-3-methylglutaryl CoA synthase
MVGITSYGAYVPRYRIDRKIVYAAMGWLDPATAMPGEKAVANFDEDTLTMAVAAGIDCLNGSAREKVDGLFLATTTAPYVERQNAGIVSSALDLRSDIRTADFADSIKAGTAALISACDAIEAGTAKSIMLCASECSKAKAGGAEEETYGDGAAALLLGDGGVIASLESSHSVSYDFVDRWRAKTDESPRVWESRFIRDVGYTKFIPEAISGLLVKCDLSIKDIAKIVYPCLYAREYAAIGRGLGTDPGQIQQEMLSAVGDTGTAHPLMALVAALEDAKPGDKIILASYGNGSDALLFQVTEEIEKARDRRGIKRHLASKKELTSYEKYATFRNLIPIETGIRGQEIAFSQLSTMWREHHTIFGLHGSKCKRCGTPQFPPQRVCVNPTCGAIDEMEDYCFSDKKGVLFTYTGDSLAFSPSPPAIYGMVNFEGGGRYVFDLTDCDLDMLKVNMPVEMSFRRKYADPARGIYGYFWKAMPPRA